MQQATVNLFADMGVQPATLRQGLVAASASTDTAPPTSTIASPTAGSTLAVGTPVTISGSASDGGGVVGGVEISVDGGTSWHPAVGRSSWSYGLDAAVERHVHDPDARGRRQRQPGSAGRGHYRHGRQRRAAPARHHRTDRQRGVAGEQRDWRRTQRQPPRDVQRGDRSVDDQFDDLRAAQCIDQCARGRDGELRRGDAARDPQPERESRGPYPLHGDRPRRRDRSARQGPGRQSARGQPDVVVHDAVRRHR